MLTNILFYLTLSTHTHSFSCGVPPIPPIGCKHTDAVCICEENGNCRWVWKC